MPQIQSHLGFDALIAAAVRQDWKYVERNISAFASVGYVLTWTALQGLRYPNEHVRDLAASLWELSPHTDFIKDVEAQLAAMVQWDSGKYARFRAACALFVHGIRSESVIARLREHAAEKEDLEVAQLAQRYLLQLS